MGRGLQGTQVSRGKGRRVRMKFCHKDLGRLRGVLRAQERRKEGQS